MSIAKKLVQAIQSLYRQMLKLSRNITKKVMNWLLRSFMIIGRRGNFSRSGFVLPTMTMVMLVVLLLTTAIVMRSFDRSKNASNARLNQVIENSATPAIERAVSKLNALLTDPNLPRGTPSDLLMISVMSDAQYTLGDETRLKVAFDFGNGRGTFTKDGNIQTVSANLATAQRLENDETLTTAWKYPIDTDGNGKFDAFNIYGLYWRSPSRRTTTGTGVTKFERARNPLEARSIPQESTGLSKACQGAGLTSATSVGDTDWYKQGANLNKAFYAYAATVPITDKTNIRPGPFNIDQFENNSRGSNGFVALEFQTDRYRKGLNNNSVWYQDDIILNPGAAFNLNGRIFTNGNLLVGGNNANINFLQVSSKYSCFYEEDNAKILVGGNVGTGDISQSTDQRAVTVDLFAGFGNNVGAGSISSITRSTTSPGGNLVGYNDAAYTARMALMKQTALSFCPTASCSSTNEPTTGIVNAVSRYPQEVKDLFADDLQNNISNQNTYEILSQEIEIYLRNRTRKVPYAEVVAPDGTGAKGSYDTDGDNIDTSVFSSGIEPPQSWREPTDANTKLTLTIANLPQTQPEQQLKDGVESRLGDRVIVGNNLPALWKNSNGDYVSTPIQLPADEAEKQYYAPQKWTSPNDKDRYRTTQVQTLSDLGVSDRNGFWEAAAALNPAIPLNKNGGGGGLRVITGAGIYVDDDGQANIDLPAPRQYQRSANSFLGNPALEPIVNTLVDVNTNGLVDANENYIPKFNSLNNIVVWPDLMPMTGGDAEQNSLNRKGDLLMRATAVYHYADGATASPNISQTPIACVSSYHDPSFGLDLNGDGDTTDAGEKDTTTNIPGLPWNATPTGRSNNGIVYNFPGRDITTNQAILQRQARLVFPNGRIVNEPLRNAMTTYVTDGGTTNFTMADYSAVDTALCAIEILNDSTSNFSTVIPNGAIKETSFLDPREVKAIDKTIDPARATNPITQFDPVTIREELNTVGANNYRTLKTNTISLDRNYDLPLEQRQPLEIRVTEIDIGRLAATSHGTFDSNADGVTENEYLLPNSGIIYASRDDALPDLSKLILPNPPAPLIPGNFQLDPTDFRLDPTRRPNGIRLINGLRLAREDTYRPEEKGLILATNLPVYIKGNFNPHLPAGTTSFTAGSTTEIEEFTKLASTSFYDRGDPNGGGLDGRFACRKSQPGCTSPGDQWRPATIIADAVTLQSVAFQDGVRSDGDFDLRNNAGNSVVDERLERGFRENNFVTSSNWVNPATGFRNPNLRNSYLNNGVTPIQRRAQFSEYLMEVCTIIPVSNCTDNDWFIDPAAIPPLKASSVIGDTLDISGEHKAGTTAQPAAPLYQRYPRRVAFLRDGGGNLVDNGGNVINPAALNAASQLVPLGINGGNVQQFSINAGAAPPATATNNALWFRTTSNPANPSTNPSYDNTNNRPLFIQQMPLLATGQPLLVPVLQIHSSDGQPGGGGNLSQGNSQRLGYERNWLQQAASTNYNAGFVIGDSPTRPQEYGAGLNNLVRFQENWKPGGTFQNATIKGSFIQQKRSTYATGPFSTIVDAVANGQAATNPPIMTIFGYPASVARSYYANNGNFGITPNALGTLPYYVAPNRVWGFDVGLLSQVPDLFSQRFAVDITKRQNFYREVGRDDDWIEALLCAAEPVNPNAPDSSNSQPPRPQRLGGPGTTYTRYAIPESERPNCQGVVNASLPYPAN